MTGDHEVSTSAAPAPVSFTLDDESTFEISRLSKETGLTPDRLVGLALRMLITASDAQKTGRKILITSQLGYPIRELLVPTR